MSCSVYLSSSGLAVSASGDNAKSPSQPLLFDSSSVPYNGVYMSGSTGTATGTNGWTETDTSINGGKQYQRSITIPFAKTFANPPRTYINVIDPNSGGATQNYSILTISQTVGSLYPTAGIGLTTSTTVSTTGLTITITEDAYGSSATSANQARVAANVAFIIFTT